MRLLPPGYVKPYVKRRKNDMADAKATCDSLLDKATDRTQRETLERLLANEKAKLGVDWLKPSALKRAWSINCSIQVSSAWHGLFCYWLTSARRADPRRSSRR